MKKLIKFSALGAVLVAMASCSGNSGKPMDSYSNLSVGDSLSYYYGEIYAADYQRMAQTDSAFMSAQARDEYLKGIAEGSAMLKGSESYNRGVTDGMQMALAMREFADETGVTLNRDILLSALNYALASDSAVNMSDAQRQAFLLRNRLVRGAQEEMKQKVTSQLGDIARKENLTQMNDELYMKPVAEGTEFAPEGTKLTALFAFKTIDGKPLDIRAPKRVVVGEVSNPSSSYGIITSHLLTSGTVEFVTSAGYYLGNQCKRYNLRPDQIIRIKVNTSPVAEK